MTTTFAEPPISYDGSKWFLIVASPRCEVSAQLQLYAKGHRTFLPKLRKWVTHARVKKAVERPILGRYLFVEVDYPRQSFAQVSNTRGVEYIVANNGIPVVVEARWVEDLMCRQLQGEWDETAKSEIPLGARVRILEGQFENLLATIIAVKGNQMFAKILGAVTVAKLHKSSIQPA